MADKAGEVLMSQDGWEGCWETDSGTLAWYTDVTAYDLEDFIGDDEDTSVLIRDGQMPCGAAYCDEVGDGWYDEHGCYLYWPNQTLAEWCESNEIPVPTCQMDSDIWDEAYENLEYKPVNTKEVQNMSNDVEYRIVDEDKTPLTKEGLAETFKMAVEACGYTIETVEVASIPLMSVRWVRMLDRLVSLTVSDYLIGMPKGMAYTMAKMIVERIMNPSMRDSVDYSDELCKYLSSDGFARAHQQDYIERNDGKIGLNAVTNEAVKTLTNGGCVVPSDIASRYVDGRLSISPSMRVILFPKCARRLSPHGKEALMEFCIKQVAMGMNRIFEDTLRWPYDVLRDRNLTNEDRKLLRAITEGMDWARPFYDKYVLG